MTRVYKTIHIDTPVEGVFENVTTPGNWPEWHASSLEVSGATEHTLEPGERARRSSAWPDGAGVWMVREREAPRRWEIDGRTEGGGGGTIKYTLTPHSGGTTFEREFVYSVSSPLLALIDWLVLRPRIKAESAEALRSLKDKLERRAT